MSDEQFVIRQSKTMQFGCALMSGLMILWYFVGPYDQTRIIYAESPKFTIILGIIFFVLFFYFLNELITRKAEITLTKEGIELRDKGFFYWEMIESFKTVYYRYSENHEEKLVLQFKDFDDLRFDISNLEKGKEELAELILKYKGRANIYFTGHESK